MILADFQVRGYFVFLIISSACSFVSGVVGGQQQSARHKKSGAAFLVSTELNDRQLGNCTVIHPELDVLTKTSPEPFYLNEDQCVTWSDFQFGGLMN